MRRDSYACSQLKELDAVLGEELVEKEEKRMWSDYGDEQDPEAWQTVLHGTREEREAYQRKWLGLDDTESDG